LGSWAPDSCEPSETDERACSSHWVNFVPDTALVVASWRRHGVFLVAFTDLSAPVEAGFYRRSSFRPRANPDFWSVYYWHGHVFASSGGDLSGLYILESDGLDDMEPSAFDEGTSWGRWTSSTSD
jgi:hypothetical protein